MASVAFSAHLAEAIELSKNKIWNLPIPQNDRAQLQVAVLSLDRRLKDFWTRNPSEIVSALDNIQNTRAIFEKASTEELAFTIREYRM